MNHDQPILDFYKKYPEWAFFNLFTRVDTLTNHFLNRPYQFEPLGEGPEGIYSSLPLYRTDSFDCVTFVNTILASAESADIDQFKENIIRLRYKNQQIDYTKRTDWFTDLEWNPNAQQLGWIEDITRSFQDESSPVIKIAKTIIDKPGWYAQKTLANLDLPTFPENELKKRLEQLKTEGQKFKPEESMLDYIPLTALFNKEGKPNNLLWQQMPTLSIIEIVRPNWRPVDPKEKSKDYGTNLNVTHLGIGIKIKDVLWFRHASIGNKVVNLPLTDYLKDFLNDPRPAPILGIHIERIIEPEVL